MPGGSVAVMAGGGSVMVSAGGGSVLVPAESGMPAGASICVGAGPDPCAKPSRGSSVVVGAGGSSVVVNAGGASVSVAAAEYPPLPRGASLKLRPAPMSPTLVKPGRFGSGLTSPDSPHKVRCGSGVMVSPADRSPKMRTGSSVIVNASGSSVSVSVPDGNYWGSHGSSVSFPAPDACAPVIMQATGPHSGGTSEVGSMGHPPMVCVVAQNRRPVSPPGRTPSVPAQVHCRTTSPVRGEISSPLLQSPQPRKHRAATLHPALREPRTSVPQLHSPPQRPQQLSTQSLTKQPQPPVQAVAQTMSTQPFPMAPGNVQPVPQHTHIPQSPHSSQYPPKQPASPGYRLENTVLRGDVLAVKGAGNFMDIGAAGGYMGHVMLVVEPPVSISKGSDEAIMLDAVWPVGISELWRIRTLESTRREQQGLHEADTLVFVEARTRRLMMVGELSDGLKLVVCDRPVPVELWQSPEELRNHLNHNLMSQVKWEMIEGGSNWSTVSALRAVLRSSKIGHGEDMLDEVQECWDRAPICTSVVIAFWQRYLCKLAETNGNYDPATIILRWMPVKADRTLPTELLSSMRRTGWSRHSVLPASHAHRELLMENIPLSPLSNAGPPRPPPTIGVRRLTPATVTIGWQHRCTGHHPPPMDASRVSWVQVQQC